MAQAEGISMIPERRSSTFRSQRVAFITALVCACLAGACASDPLGTARESAPSTPTGTYRETKDLVGQELIDALGLEPLQLPRGMVIKQDDPRLGLCAKDASERPAGTVDTGTQIYCLAGVAESEFQEWDLALRIQGYDPCPLDEDAFRLSVEAERLSEAGEEDLARDASNEAQDLRIQAQADPACGLR